MKNKNSFYKGPLIRYILFSYIFLICNMAFGQQEMNVRDAVSKSYIDLIVKSDSGYEKCHVEIKNLTGEPLAINFNRSFFMAPRRIWGTRESKNKISRNPQRLGVNGNPVINVEPYGKKEITLQTRCLDKDKTERIAADEYTLCSMDLPEELDSHLKEKKSQSEVWAYTDNSDEWKDKYDEHANSPVKKVKIEKSEFNGYHIFEWKEGKYLGSKYEGGFLDGKFHGFGDLDLKVNPNVEQKNGDTLYCKCYTIPWANEYSEGEYIGEWKGCNFSGYGIYYSHNLIKSGIWNSSSNELIEMPEQEILDYLNKKYNKNYQAKAMVYKEKEIAKKVKEEEELEKNLNQNLKSNIDSTKNTAAKVQIIDSTNIYGQIEKYVKITWEANAVNVEGDTTGNYISGSYMYSDATNVKTLLHAINISVKDKKILKFIEESNNINIKILASADKPSPNHIYKGEYGKDISGDFQVAGKDISLPGEPDYATNLKSGFPIKTNILLAYIRAYGAKWYINENIPEFSDDKTKFQLVAKEYNDQIGDQYRKLSIAVTIKLPKDKKKDEGPNMKEYDKIEYFDSIPKGVKDNNTLAFIISNYKYTSLSPIETGEADGDLFYTYCKKSFGLNENQINYYKNTTCKELEKLFERNIATSDIDNKNIVIYFSAHGSTTTKKEPVIMGCEATGAVDGLLLDSIYLALSKLEKRYKSAIVIFDCCYTTGGKADIIIENIRKPMYLCKKTVFIHATSGSISRIYQDKNHSFFTYFLCKSIFDNKNNKDLTIRNLFRDVKKNVLNASGINPQVPYIFPEDKPDKEILDNVLIKYIK